MSEKPCCKELQIKITQLDEEKRKFQLLFENMLQEVHLWEVVRDESHKIKTWKLVDANPAALRSWGKSLEEVVGKTTDEIFPGVNATETFKPIVEKIFSDGAPCVWEKYFPGTNQHLQMISVSLGEFFISSGKDITQEKQIEKALKETRINLDEAVTAANVGLWDWDLTSNKVHYSREWKNQIGYEDHEIDDNYNEWETRVHPDDLQAALDAINACIKDPAKKYEVEFRLKHKDGSYRWIFSHASIIKKHGETIRLVGSHIDITERKKSEDAYQQTKKLLQYIVEHSPISVAVHDKDLNYLYVSQSYLDDHGVVERDVIGKHHYEVFPDLPQKWRDVHQRALAGEVLSADEDDYPRTDGTVMWTNWECRPWYEGNGEIGGIIVYSEVITDRVIAREKQRQSEERFQRIFEESPMGRALCDEKGKFLKVNRAFKDITGYSLPEISQLTFKDITSEEFQDEEARLFNDLADGVRSSYKIEKQCVHKDGHLFWARVNAAKFFDSENSPPSYIGSIENIDEEKQLDIELKQKKETISLLLNTAAEGIYGLDKEGNCTFCNKSGIQMLGYDSEEDLLGKNMHELIHHTRIDGTSYPLNECKIFKSFETGEKFHCDNEVLWTADGNSFPAEYWSHPIIKDGCTIGSVVTFLNISARKQTEKALKESEEHHRRLYIETPVMMHSIDKNGTIVNVSEMWLKKMGYERYEVIGHRSTEFLTEKSRLYAQEVVLPQFFETGEVKDIPYNFVKKNGDIMQTLLSATAEYDDEGQFLRSLAVIVDITLRNKLLAEQSRSAQLVALGTVAAGVAHEINNPMQGVIALAGMLERLPGDPEKTMQVAKRIREEGQKVAKITRDLLFYSKDNRIEKTYVDVQETIASALSLISTKLKNKGIALVFDIQDDLPKLFLQPQSLQQVVLNLVDNAYDALRTKEDLDEDKIIIVKAGLVANKVGEKASFLCIDVQDNGIGMNEEVQHKCQEAFYTTKPPSEGTGLGMSIVNDIIRKHDGYIEIDSREGEYTKIRVMIPKIVVSDED